MSSIHNSAPSSFSALAKGILRSLDHLINVPTTACPGLEDHETLGADRLMDVRTRFLLWTGNLGAMHKPEDPRALDRRLFDVPEVAGRVREILRDLQDHLSQSGRSCDCGASQGSLTEQVNPMDEEEAMMMQLLGLQTSKKCTTSYLAASIDDSLHRLFHLSSLITKSSTRDKFVRAEVKCRLGMYEDYDIQHVREKVDLASGRADEGLVTRLGKANTSRRQFIAYSHEHNAELSHLGPDDDKSSGQGHTKHEHNSTTGKSSIGQSVLRSQMTKQSAVPTKASTVGLVDPNAFDYGLDDARSCTMVATSIVDGQAFSGLKVPELAHYAKPGEHFICPLCQTVQRFNGQAAWGRHIFSDIRAYICMCPMCELVHHDKMKARMHIIQHYSNSDGHHQVDLLLQTSSRLPEHLSADDCPFCGWSATLRKRNIASREHDLTVPSRRFMKHLGRHLEEIALFVVPQPDEDDGDLKDIGSNEVHVNGIDDNYSVSTLSSFRSVLSAREGAYAKFEADVTLPPDAPPPSTTEQNANDLAVHCFCGFTEDDGNVVACDSCDKWAHVICYYPRNSGNLPDDLQHWCLECRPGQFDTAHILDVQARQRTLRKQAALNLPKAKAKRTRQTAIPRVKSSIEKLAVDPTGATNEDSSSKKVNEGLCPYRACGKYSKDIATHILTQHAKSNERPEKCLDPSCQYHTKGFARRYDRNRHVLAHYAGTIVCGLCPGPGTSAEKNFTRVDIFKRHLTIVHGAEQTIPKSRRRADPERSSDTANHGGTGDCSTCGNTSSRVQDFYDHLDDCMLSNIQNLLSAAEFVDHQNLVENPRLEASLPDSPETFEQVYPNLSPPMTPVYLQPASQGPTYPHSLQQLQPQAMPQWPPMLNTQSHETYSPYHPPPLRPISSASADEPTSALHQTPDYQMQLQLLEKQNKKRLSMARQEIYSMSQSPGWATNTDIDPIEIELFRRQANIGSQGMSDGQMRDSIVRSRSKSFLDQTFAPQQADDQQPSSSPQAPRLPSIKNISDPQSQYAWQTADSQAVFPSYGSSREDAHVNFAKSVAERTSQPGAVPPDHELREGLNSNGVEAFDAVDLRYEASVHNRTETLPSSQYLLFGNTPAKLAAASASQPERMSGLREATGYSAMREHKYPKPDNPQRHMRAQHAEKPREDETLQDALDQRAEDESYRLQNIKNFREKYYPTYTKLYDDISERQAKGETVGQDEMDRVWKMHKRLEELKREIAAAANTGEA